MIMDGDDVDEYSLETFLYVNTKFKVSFTVMSRYSPPTLPFKQASPQTLLRTFSGGKVQLFLQYISKQ